MCWILISGFNAIDSKYLHHFAGQLSKIYAYIHKKLAKIARLLITKQNALMVATWRNGEVSTPSVVLPMHTISTACAARDAFEKHRPADY